MNRRYFLASTSAFATLAACAGKPTPRVPPPAIEGVSVDIHTHIFNGRDIPVVGFLEQVILREAADPVDSAQLPALARLIIDVIIAASTKDAATELAGLGTPAPAWSVAADERNLSKGINAFAERVNSTRSTRTAAIDPDAAQDAALLDLLRRAAPATQGFNRAATPAADADAIAAAAFGRITDAPSALRSLGRAAGGFSAGNIFAKLRWAAFLTNDRATILSELKRYYGRQTQPDGTKSAGIDVFSPSLVDMGLWFNSARDAGPGDDVAEQMALMSALALRDNDALILNFAPFCPLRALKTRGWFDVVKTAVMTKGFAGVKLYPPVGFQPRGNDPARLYGARGRFQANGAQLDQVLDQLFRWCAANGVPIKTHANDSIAAGVCSGAGAAPSLWRDVLADNPDLRLNLAHFGGFEPAPVGCPPHATSFEAQATTLILDPRFDNVYADLGYWTEGARPGDPASGPALSAFEAQMTATPQLAERLIYGSDWTMIAQDNGFESYFRDIDTTLRRLLGPGHNPVMGTNALRFLDLEDPESPQSRRLRRFFPAGHFFYSVLPHQTPL